ncbi:MAG: hypothetical protein QOH98_369, partial [Methylobacteriaceae bacterium]|nr:hypothetical protein [Methylobacteriaceae bacterium]
IQMTHGVLFLRLPRRKRGRFASNLFVSELRLVEAQPETGKRVAINPMCRLDI